MIEKKQRETNMLSAVFKIKTLFQFNLCAAQLDSCCQFYLHTPAFGFKNRLKKKKRRAVSEESQTKTPQVYPHTSWETHCLLQ